jgi:hypothetical protein
MYEQGCTCHSLSIAYTCHIQQTHAHAHATCTCARRCTRAHATPALPPLPLSFTPRYGVTDTVSIPSLSALAALKTRQLSAAGILFTTHRRPPAQSQASATRRVVARLSPSRGATSLELSSPTIAPFRIRRLLGAPARCAGVLLTLRLGHEHGQRPAVGGYTYPILTPPHSLTDAAAGHGCCARVPCMHADSVLFQKRTPCVSLTSIR